MNLESTILLTLHYSDIFNYPLTQEEIISSLITSIPVAKQEIQHCLATMTGKAITYHAPFYCLIGREHIITLRQQREKISEEKIKSVERTVTILRYIPTLRCIGLSGSLAKKNADKDADIDLFVITAAGTLWISRLLILVVLQLLGKRRSRGMKSAEDRVCLNFLLDEKSLEFSQERHDIYTAHEIVQMQPLFSDGSAYRQFLFANQWVWSHLANVGQFTFVSAKFSHPRYFVALLFTPFEPLARWAQWRMIHSHTATEKIAKNVAAFHPRDYRAFILHSLDVRKKIVKNRNLWDIDKQKKIIYTRKDHVSLPYHNGTGEFFLDNLL